MSSRVLQSVALRTAFAVLLPAACAACSSSDSNAPGPSQHGDVEAEALKFFVDGGELAAVSLDRDKGFLAAGTVGREALLLRITASGTITDESTTLPALAWKSCPKPGVFLVYDLTISPGGRGLLIGRGTCDGTDGALFPLVVEYLAGKWRQIGPDELGGDFYPEAAHCADATCYLLANRQPIPWNSVVESSSVTVLSSAPGKWKLELDEREDDENFGYQGTAIVSEGSNPLIAFVKAQSGSTTEEVPIVRVQEGGTWRELPSPGYVLRRAKLHQGTPYAVGTRGGTLQHESVVLRKKGDGFEPVWSSTQSSQWVLDWAMLEGKPLGAGQFALDHGYLPYAVHAGRDLTIPPYQNSAGVSAVASDGSVALAVGMQTADNPTGGARLIAPLLMRMSSSPLGVSDGVLPNNPPNKRCHVPADCFHLTWGVSCAGHFTCEDNVCARECDEFACDGKPCHCGNGKCDTDVGENKASCPADCK